MAYLKRYPLSGKERLKHRKVIEALFKNGKSSTVFPYRIVYMISKESEPALRAGFAVSVKHFKKAVDRNRIKRLMKENYRVRKNILREKTESLRISLSVFIIYISKEMPKPGETGEKMHQVITRLIKNINENDIADR